MDRQVAQLLLQVDANVAVAQRDLQNLARVVRQSSGDMNSSIDTTVQRHSKLSGAFNQSRIAQMELSHVMTASVDAYAAGASPLRILQLEMGRLAQAASFLGGEGGGVLGKLGAFMSGPWGVAVLLGVAAISQLIGKMGETGDTVDSLVAKMREHAHQADLSKQADAAWALTLDGLIDKNEKLVESLKKRLQVEAAVDLATLASAKREQQAAQKDLNDLQQKVDNLKKQLASTPSGPSAGGVGIGQGAVAGDTGRASLVAQLAQAEDDLTKAKKRAIFANNALIESQINVGQAEGKALADLGAASQRWGDLYQSSLTGRILPANKALSAQSTEVLAAFQTLKKAMDDAAGAGAGDAFYAARTKAKDLGNELAKTSNVTKYATEVQKLVASLEAAAKAARDAKKETASSSGEFGKHIGFAEATDIAKSAGLTVTSGYRSTAKQAELYRTVRTPENPVARPGTSAHEGVNGKWALDIAFAPGLTPEKIRKIYGDQGVSLSAIYKETGHYHIEGRQEGGTSAQTAARKDQAAQVAGIRQQGAFDQALDRLNQELLQAQSQLTQDYNQRADIAEKQVDADNEKLKDSIQEQLDLGKATDFQQGITEAQAQILNAKADELKAAKKAAIEQQRQLQALDSKQANADQQYGFELDGLKFADEMAKTSKEHRALQLEILDIEYAQKKADLEILKAKQELAGLTDDAARTQAEINNLPTAKARDVQRVTQGTLDPLQKYFNDIPHTADQINESLKSIEAEGIDGLVNALSHAGEGWKSMRDIAISTLQDIASQLIRLGIQRMIFNLFGNAVLGGLGGTASAGMDFSGSFGAVAGAGDFSGAALGGGVGDFSTGFGDFGGVHFATGGFVSGPGTPTSDSIPAMLSNGEYVMNAEAVRKFGVGYLDMMNGGHMPHMKHGGLLGGLLGGGMFGLLAGILSGGNPLLMAGVAGGLFGLGNKIGGPFGDILRFAGSPALFLGEAAFKHLGHDGKGPAIPGAAKIKIPQAANNNTRMGDTYNVHVIAPNTGDPLKDRQTGMQFAAGFQAQLARKQAKGLA